MENSSIEDFDVEVITKQPRNNTDSGLNFKL